MHCNARKSDLLLSEWRHGKRLPKWRTEIKLRPRGPARIRRESVPKTCKVFFGTCVECDQAFSSRSARSTRCVDRRLYQRTAERPRSEEHTSELQSLMRSSYAVFCLKKKKTRQ